MNERAMCNVLPDLVQHILSLICSPTKYFFFLLRQLSLESQMFCSYHPIVVLSL